jgi:phosphoribosylformylglycinamidine synthase PurS subunit
MPASGAGAGATADFRLHKPVCLPHHGRTPGAGSVSSFKKMKARIIVTPKKAVLDPQGKTVQSALQHLGYTGISAVHVGKYIEIDLAQDADPAAARRALDDACHKFLSNPIIEDYRLDLE